MSHEDVFASQILELRRGTIVLAILSQLTTPHYGYGLLQELERMQVLVDAGTVYPLLRRLEKQGVLESFWDTDESRPRKYYRLTDTGNELYKKLTNEWYEMSKSVQRLIQEEI